MEQLSVEEKAKRYDEAIERAKTKLTNEVASDIFPELKESREDEMIRVIKEVILNSVPYKINILTKDTTITAEEAIAWLKSLKERCTWKPSKEQMYAVKDAIDYLGGDTKIVRKYLMSLYEDLKKL